MTGGTGGVTGGTGGVTGGTGGVCIYLAVKRRPKPTAKPSITSTLKGKEKSSKQL